MSNCLNKIGNNRETVLLGEIGALLHDIGKCHPDFIRSKSLKREREGNVEFKHAEGIDGFIDVKLLDYFKDGKVEITLNGDTKTIYDLIKEHHNENGRILEYLGFCDKQDSADDKGVVRELQSVENVIIASPFGYPKEKIDLDGLSVRFKNLEKDLICVFENYISGVFDIVHFRRFLLNKLEKTFSHALGETRVPANDVALWDHSYSTASLFKSVLAANLLGVSFKNKPLRWRIFGICWGGVDFIDRGKKVAEIQKRAEIIEEVKRELREKFEEDFPIGNAVYEDTNGIYFTFPGINNKSFASRIFAKGFAQKCAAFALEIINEKTENELYPFFTLSRPSNTLTVIADEIRFASEKRKIPKMSPVIFIEGENGREETYIYGSSSNLPQDNNENNSGEQDICPICKIRVKNAEEERCGTCEKRKEGRLESWKGNRQDTIWIDETADKNNRIALISLSFNINKWLDGTMIETVYSQTFEDWVNGEKYKTKKVDEILERKGKNLKSDLYKRALDVAEIITSTGINVKDNNLAQCFMEKGNRISDKIVKEPEHILRYFFTKNASPARLYRVWNETREFFDLVAKEIKMEIYRFKWMRLQFSITNYDSLGIEENQTYLINFSKEEVNPKSLLVLHTSDGEFYTIESLEKFSFNDKAGEEAVKEAFKKDGDIKIKIGENEKKLKISNDIKTEEFYPLIEINKSPLMFRFIVPALDSVKIIELITKLYNERFEKVIGKLPLNIGLLVANRKFPLYVLLDAERRMFEGESFNRQVETDPWWDVIRVRSDKYYSYYPKKRLEGDEGYFLHDLSQVSKGKTFSLFPGYFYFDLLLATTDRYKINYTDKEDGRIKRLGEEYRLYTGRPYYFYQISVMLELWDILSNISSSQITFIEEMLSSKLREWRGVNGDCTSGIESTFRKFAEATLKDAFGNKWYKLRAETRYFLVSSALSGILLDTIVLFKHVIKKEADKDE